MKPFKHEIQKKKWDQLRKKRLLHGFLISGCCTLAFTGAGVGVGYAIWNKGKETQEIIGKSGDDTFSVPKASDVPYHVDGHDWPGNINDGQHNLGKTYFSHVSHYVDYKDPGTISFANGMVFPDFVKDDNNEVYAVHGIGTNSRFDGSNAHIRGVVQLPKHLFQIGDRAFYGCKDITGFDFKNVNFKSFTYIGQNAFKGCSNIIYVQPGTVLVDKAKDLGLGQNYHCFVLKNDSDEFNSHTSIKNISLSGCGDLAYGDVRLDSNVIADDFKFFDEDEYGASYFGLNINPSSRVDMSQVTWQNIPPYFFKSTAIKNIILPITISTIDEWSFSSCLNLTSFDFSNMKSLETLSNDSQFYSCDNLSSVTVGPHIKTLGDMSNRSSSTYFYKIFFNCSQLDTFDFSRSTNLVEIGDGVFNGGPKMTTLDFTDCINLKKIGGFTFCEDNSSASTIQEIKFGSSIDTIGDKCFLNCSALKLIDFGKVNVPTNLDGWATNAFDGVRPGIKIQTTGASNATAWVTLLNARYGLGKFVS